MEESSIEIRARTTDEAIRIALERLGATEDEVDIEVLSEGRAGVFGMGGQEARVRVSLLGEEEDYEEEPQPGAGPVGDENAALARETLERMLDLLEFPNIVTVRGIEREKGMTIISLDVAGDDVALLIGRHGETLASLQFLLNACLHQSLPRNTRVVVDVEHYRDRREQSLRSLAIRAADRVRRERRAITLQPMPPNERRVIHLALQTSPWVSTESTGEGVDRRVVISPKPGVHQPPRRPSSRYSRPYQRNQQPTPWDVP